MEAEDSPLAPTTQSTQSTQPCSTHSSAPRNSCAGPPKAQFVLTPLLTSVGFSPGRVGARACLSVCLQSLTCASAASVLAETQCTEPQMAAEPSRRRRGLGSLSRQPVEEMERGGGITELIILSLYKPAGNGSSILVISTDISEQNSLIKPTVPFYLLLKLLLAFRKTGTQFCLRKNLSPCQDSFIYRVFFHF